KIEDFIEFVVMDTGPGIPENLKDILFERQYSTKSTVGKTERGVGLLITRFFVEDMNGSIFIVENNNHSGATIAFRIPLTTQEVNEDESD
ncbi:MAG TPA: ATP-binding protein, partial [Roseiflexaceae bacterium]|nr:ATP-binding protein [Roseiflexaceae bacterium]